MFGQVPSPARVDVPRQRRSKADQPAPGHDCDPARPRCRDGTQTRHRIKAGSDGGPTGLGRALWTPIPHPSTTRAQEIGIHMGGEGPHQTLRKHAGVQARDRLRQPLRYIRSYLTNTQDNALRYIRSYLANTQDSAFVVRWRSGTRLSSPP